MAAARPSADLPRVAEALEMLAPRWSAWVLMTLAAHDEPLRYSAVKASLPWLADGQLHPKLRALGEAGLVERTAHSRLHVTYGLTGRGRELQPVLEALAAWGDTHLEKDLVLNRTTGRHETERIPAAQNAEDTLAVLSHRYATVLLWTLRWRGPSTMAALSTQAVPGLGASTLYGPIRRLIDDGLVTVTPGEGAVLQLSAPGQDLAPLYRALSAWATGRPHTDTHPVWGAPTPAAAVLPVARSGQWAAHQARHKATPAIGVSQSPATAPAPALGWRPADLFSTPTSGPSR
ncbi:winged helix-turn-helix transcriptional regulator [Streptomyces sp. NPDC059070]|uniref:winged helix-turn-helix transcriptional regulator n=1 Tax=Streptomyces sp. NPDC059070 TaxID=3346713 RepID=UPI0036AB25BD